MLPKTADLAIFTEGILNGKLFCEVLYVCKKSYEIVIY